MSDRPLIVVNPSTVTVHTGYDTDLNGGSITGTGLTVSDANANLQVGFFITSDVDTGPDTISKISSHLSAIAQLLSPTGGE